MKNEVTAVLYTRDVRGTAPTAEHKLQEKALTRFCKKNGIKIVKVVHDTGSHTDFENRTEFSGLLNDLTEKKLKADLFLITHQDVVNKKRKPIYDLYVNFFEIGIIPYSLVPHPRLNMV